MTNDQIQPTQHTRRLPREDALIAVLLALTLLAGVYFRFVGQNWDEHTHLHPDERFLSQVTAALGTTTLPQYFDTAASPLNPNNVGYGFYVYGTLPVFVVKLVATLYTAITGDPGYLLYGQIHLVGRDVSALSDVLTILVTFWIGRRLFGKWVGLLAAMFYTGAVLPIQISHFATVDAFTTLMVMLAMGFAVRVLDEDRWYDYALFGLFFGAAMASRINVLPLAGVLVLAALVRALPAFEMGAAPRAQRRILGRGLGLLVLAGVISIVVFRVAMPYAFNGPGFIPSPYRPELYEGLIAPQSRLPFINLNWMDQMQRVAGQVSGQADFPPNHQWAGRTPYLFPLRNMVVWGLGVPLGLLGWLGWAWGMWRALRGHEDWTRPLLPAMWILVYFGWQGRQWVMSMRYYVIFYPLLCIFAAWSLASLWRWARGRAKPARVGVGALAAGALALTWLYAFGFTGIYRRTFTRVEASRWFRDNVPGDMALYIESEGEDGARAMVNIGIGNGFTDPDDPIDTDDELIASATRYFDAKPDVQSFTAPISGTVSEIVIPHLGDPNRDPGAETFRITLATEPDGGNPLAQVQLREDLGASAHPLGASRTLALPEPVHLLEGETYYLISQAVEGAPVTIAGAIVADEGQWDDPIPYKVDGWDGFGMGYYQSLRMHMAYEDIPEKRDIMLYNLDHADYLTISSNRFYDSLARNPLRWPMSIRYYQALFSGELGYELVRAFTSFPSIGPFELNDRWAEEAFHVYDHPIVMVFRRTEDYRPEDARAILDSVDLDDVVRRRADQADEAPTYLKLPDRLWQQQKTGGTWSARYDSEGPLARHEWLAVLVWWAVIVILGWLAFPLLFAALPGLPDRGYPLAKVLGLVVVGWLPWLVTSAGVPLWNAAGVALAVVALGLVSMAVMVARQEALVAYVRAHWRRLLAVEMIALILYFFWIYIRLGNPDLWHPSFGGEKPMEFAYMNAVLKSVNFPPYDPWFAGGYINYYYFGYVIVGAPVLLLRLVPALAFNLILCTLYALTGTGAFSLAFNLVAGLKARKPRDGVNRWVNRHASPWVAGTAALVLAVSLGNLDTLRVIVGGLAQTGGWDPLTQTLPTLDQILGGVGALFRGGALAIAPHHWYWRPSRVMESIPGRAINEFPYFTFLYADLHAHVIAMPITYLMMGWALGQVQSVEAERKRGWVFGALALGIGALAVGVLDPTNHWDWITYLIVGVVTLSFVNLLRLRRDSGREVWAWLGGGSGVLIGILGVFALGAAFLTLQQNSFTAWLTLALAGGAILAALSLLRLDGHIKRLAVRWVGEVVAFLGLALLAVLPFNLWFGTTYSSVQFYQSGDVTPLWAYIDMHGLFLFIVICLALWETVVWLRKTRVEALRGRLWPAALLAGAVIVALLAALYLAIIGVPTEARGIDPETGMVYRHHYQSLLISVPLVLWLGLLFLRPNQGREKRVVLAAAALALLLTIGVEFVVLVGDIGRQNTVFKFYIQVWLLLSAAGGAAVAWLWRASDRWYPAPRTVWTVLFGLLVMVGALFPLTATRGKFTDRMSHEVPLTLNGMAFMQYATHGESGVYFPLKGDYEAIRWLQENVEGTPVVLEAHLGEYHWGARYAIYTGLPAVLGWNFHQRQQRTVVPHDTIWNRANDVGTIYNTTDMGEAWRLLQAYGVVYIIVGETEHATYDPAGLAKFEAMVEANLLRPVYDEANTAIYRVVG